MQTIYVPFNHFEIELPIEALENCHHTGQCYPTCLAYHSEEYFKDISLEDMQKELLEYGAWTIDELQNRKENEIKLLWLASGDYQDGKYTEENE